MSFELGDFWQTALCSFTPLFSSLIPKHLILWNKSSALHFYQGLRRSVCLNTVTLLSSVSGESRQYVGLFFFSSARVLAPLTSTWNVQSQQRRSCVSVTLRLHRDSTVALRAANGFLLWLSVWTGNKEADQTPTQKAATCIQLEGGLRAVRHL